MPVRNGERYLAEAIESVLAQRPQPLEVIVVDDGSEDGTAAVVRRFDPHVRLLSQAGRGSGAARNAGLAASTASHVAFLDADDLWNPGKLAVQLAALSVDPRLDLVFGRTRQFITPDLDPASAARRAVSPRPVPAYLSGVLLARRGAFARVGGFREDVATAEFVDWMARARECGLRERMLEEVVLLRRIHASNHGIVRTHARVDYVRVLKAARDRRRTAPDTPA
jgi:glycosyltransferase involved in cell wall biosynthesis